MDLFIKIAMLVVFFGVMIGVGIYCRKKSTDVDAESQFRMVISPYAGTKKII